jgi:hypothetical protein
VTVRRASLALILALASITTVLASPAATSATTLQRAGVWVVRPGRPAAVPAIHRPGQPTGQYITGHPPVLAAVNAARARQDWPPARYGSNLAAEACALNTARCNGVQWGGCPLTPLPGNRYTVTIGTAVSDGPRGCVQAISYSSFG